MKNVVIKRLVGIAVVALAAGCSTDRIHSWMRHDAAELTDFLPGLGLVSDYIASGEIAIECRVRDAATGEVVLMFADAKASLRRCCSSRSSPIRRRQRSI